MKPATEYAPSAGISMQRNIATRSVRNARPTAGSSSASESDTGTYTAGSELHMGGADMPRRPAAADGIGEWSRGNGTRGRNRK